LTRTAIYRQQAQTSPDAVLPYLARSLNNQSNRLSDMGRREEALAAIEEAVTIYRQLAQRWPAAFVPDLVMSLNNLADALATLRRKSEADAARVEAARFSREI